MHVFQTTLQHRHHSPDPGNGVIIHTVYINKSRTIKGIMSVRVFREMAILLIISYYKFRKIKGILFVRLFSEMAILFILLVFILIRLGK